MELGYAVVIPTFVLFDANLSPLERLLYGVLSATANKEGYCTATNEMLASALRTKVDGVTKQVSPEALSRMLKHLEECGTIIRKEQDGGRVIVVIYQKQNIEVTVKAKPAVKTDDEAKEIATKVLDYLSASSVIRGIRKVPYKHTPANLQHILARVGESVEDAYERCISVINIKFLDKYFLENPKYLSPETLFRPSNFEKYLNESSRVQDIHLRVVTKAGLELPEGTHSEEVATF